MLRIKSKLHVLSSKNLKWGSNGEKSPTFTNIHFTLDCLFAMDLYGTILHIMEVTCLLKSIFDKVSGLLTLHDLSPYNFYFLEEL